MPIILPNREKALFDALKASGAAVIYEREAKKRDIYPARIGLLNLMPAPSMARTESHWLRAISDSVLQIEPVFVKFDNDPREQSGSSRRSILARYQPFSKVAEKGLHGLIVSGDNLELRRKAGEQPELLPLEDIFYARQLVEAIQWARKNVYTTIYSCLAAHFALGHLYKLERRIADKKIFGVFEHTVSTGDFTHHMDDTMLSPHSRWGEIEEKALRRAGLKTLAVSNEAGWLLTQDSNNADGRDLFIQGHPEYGRSDLADEYRRDQRFGIDPPSNYFLDGKPRLSWTSDAQVLYSNWIKAIYDSW